MVHGYKTLALGTKNGQKRGLLYVNALISVVFGCIVSLVRLNKA